MIGSLSTSFLIIVTFISILLLGFRRDKNSILKNSILRVVLYTIIAFFCITYLLGLKTGFLRNAYSLKLTSIVDNMFAPLLIILSMEMIRYIFISANKDDSKIYTYIITVVLIAFEICIYSKGNPFKGDLIVLFKSFTTTYIPIIIKNICLSYLTTEAGYKPSIVYRLILELSTYLMPIVPNLGDYFESIKGIVIPLMIYIFTSRTIDEYYKKEASNPEKKAFNKVDIPFIVIFAILIALISDFFPLQIIGIASQSMQNSINKGDAVFIYKLLKDDDINKGDVIAYRYNDKIIVHRVISKKCDNGKCLYRTKGDANNVKDDATLSIKDIKGKVLFKIVYIAYPSVWISEWLERD
jgi:signal peptidase I